MVSTDSGTHFPVEGVMSMQASLIDSARLRPGVMNLLDSCHQRFGQDGYCTVPSILAAPDLPSLRQHHDTLRRSGRMYFGAVQSKRRWILHNEEVAQIIQLAIIPVMSIVAGAEVRPSFTYTAIYDEGADPPAQGTPEQREYSVALRLDADPDAQPRGEGSQPLWLATPAGAVPIAQEPGDALFYRGRELVRGSTTPPRGRRWASVFLHYVSKDFPDTPL
jgi:hypothetical protein